MEVIAVDKAIRDLARLKKCCGPGRWRKFKGIATVRLVNGRLCQAELHWQEAHGIGRKRVKIRCFLD